MRHAARLFLILTTFTTSLGCAGPRFYRLDAQHKEVETGIPIYPTRVFLVVSSNGAKAGSVTVSIVRLPDLAADPIYARQVRGWGSGEISVEFDGGVLKAVGGKSDAQGADAIDALGSLTGAAGALLKAVRSNVSGEGEPPEPAFQVYEVVMSKAGTRLEPVTVVQTPATP